MKPRPPDRIPNRFHFIFGLQPDFGGKPFSFIHHLAILSAAVVNRPTEVVLHLHHEPSGEWWERTRDLVNLDHVGAAVSVAGRPISHYAHRADVLRLEILVAEGGIYLDVDTFCIRPFRPLLVHPTVMGVEPNAGLCNAVILAEKGSEFVRIWRDRYADFDERDWRTHSVRLPYFLSRERPDLIHVEDEYSFFFPTYDDPMHVLLWSGHISVPQRLAGMARVLANAAYYARGNWPVRIVPYLRHLLSTRACFESHLRDAYCLHLWESLWWEPYLHSFTPEALRSDGGLFARLVTSVIGSELGLQSPTDPAGSSQ